MIKTVLLFDIDGTLLLTGGAGQIAIDQAFEELFGVADAWG
ncbi:MAG: phosphoglycolate phosphatase, partial [Candidatus Omnitrophota bacterium]